MRPKGQITPYKLKGRELFVATFQHPLLKKRVTRALGTTFEPAAIRICEGLQVLCRFPKIDVLEAHAIGVSSRAWNIFLKDTAREKLDSVIEEPKRFDRIRNMFPEWRIEEVVRTADFVDGLSSGIKDQFSLEYEYINSVLLAIEFHPQKIQMRESFRRFLEKVGKRITQLHDALRNANEDLDAFRSVDAHGYVKSAPKDIKKKVASAERSKSKRGRPD